MTDPFDFHDNDPDDLPVPIPENRWRRPLIRALAVLMALSFLLLAGGGVLRLLGMPALGLLASSRTITRDPAVQGWMRAVVRVEADGRGGTGFNIDPAGRIITNGHITEDADRVGIDFGSDGGQYVVDAYRADADADLAVLPLGAAELPWLALERDAPPEPGDEVLVIGNPLGLFRVVSRATVLGSLRIAGMPDPVLMLDGPVYRGNSGSPVLNGDGRVVGVVFAMTEHPESGRTVALAIPASAVAAFADAAEAAGSLP